MLPGWQLFLLRRSVRTLIFDFDDAVFLRDSYSPKGLHHAGRLRRFAATIRACDAVVAGNRFLAEQAIRCATAARIEVIPTCVDPTQYPPVEPRRSNDVQLVWVGSSSTLQGLQAVEPLLAEIGRGVPDVRLKLICDRFFEPRGLPVINCPWNAASEAAEIGSADIGIAHVPDDLWSRGKCGLKVLQYMAAGLPVVANPVGVHTEMVRHGETGFLAETPAQWVDAIARLAQSRAASAHGPHGPGTAGSALQRRGRSEALVRLAGCDRTTTAEGGMTGTIDHDVGGVRWSLRPDLYERRDELFDADGLRLNEWLADGRATVLKQANHRALYHVALPELDFHLKRYPAAGVRAWLQHLVRPSRARAEYDRALTLATLHVPAVEGLGIGEARHGASWFLTRTVPHTQPLSEFFETALPALAPARQTRLRQRLARELGRLLATMHNAGAVHDDLHPANILLRLVGDDEPMLCLVDLLAVRLGPPLRAAARFDNLVVFNRWFALRSDRSDRLRFWHAYDAACGSAGVNAKPQAAEIEQRTLTSNLRFWRQHERRCLGDNRYFCRVRAGDVSGHAVADLPPADLAALLADPDEPFRRPGVIVLKDSPSSSVVELELPGSRRVIWKRFIVTTRSDPWAALFRPTPALRSYVMGHGLRLRGLPTPRPLAVLHRRRFGLPHEGYLLTEKVPDARDLAAFVAELASQPPTERRRVLRGLIDRLARLIRTFHERGLSHRDLKAPNLLVSRAGWSLARSAKVWLAEGGTISEDAAAVWFIDLVGVKRHGHLSLRCE